jgi:hypothetical protein
MSLENTNPEGVENGSVSEGVKEDTFTFSIEKQGETATVIPENQPLVNTPAPPATIPDAEPASEEPEYEYIEIEDEEYEELNDDLAIKHLANSKGMSVEEFNNSLTPKEQKKYAPELEKYQEFIDKTGNTNFKDFEATQIDWKAADPDTVLKELIKSENPLLSAKEVDFVFDKKYNSEGLDEELDEDQLTQIGINRKVDFAKATEFLEKRKQEYMVNRGSDDHIPAEFKEAKTFREEVEKQQNDFEIVRQANRDDYVSKTEDFYSQSFEGFKVELGNKEIGFEEVSFKPENIQETKSYQQNLDNFNKEFFDETGKLVKPNEWCEALYMAKNYKSELNKAFNRGIAKQLELDDKLSKNIQPDNLRNVQQNRAEGFTFTVEK